jgi:hypothetical protein
MQIRQGAEVTTRLRDLRQIALAAAQRFSTKARRIAEASVVHVGGASQ